ncbi:MAG: beta-lactamase family protein [bacterium]|nr:beta-lactamase family protein [bacterium]
MQLRISKASPIRLLKIAVRLFACAVFALYLSTGATLSADETDPNAITGSPRTAQNFARFFEERVPAKLDEHAVAGAVVAVVHKGRVVYSGGFGCARITPEQACESVDPQRTLFRVASISKLFTFTALMQLIEQGRVDLDADVNEYVQRRDPDSGEILFRIPELADQRPVLVRDLLVHTTGFEDRAINLFADDPARAQNLREAVEVLPPQRVLPAGQEIAYSNYGAILAGYIVEQVSGESFEDYVEKNIFAPLNMRSSSFRQPLPAALAAKLSDGFLYTGEMPEADAEPETIAIDPAKFEAQVFEIIQGTSAGGLSTTADDLGRFLATHLAHHQGGRSGALLSPATARQMHSTLFRPHALGNGFAHGFMELDSHGQRIIGHSGDTIFFHSLAGIMPEQDLGFFISTNSATGTLPVWELRAEFLDTFFPAPTGQVLAQEFQTVAPIDLDAYPGFYTTNRRSETDFTKVIALFMSINVKLNETGDGLLIRDFFSGELLDFVAIAPDVFQEREGHKRFVFLRNASGEVASLLVNDIAIMTFHRVAWYEWPPLHFAIIAIGAILIIGGFVFRPTGLMMALSRGYRAGLDADARRAGWVGFGIVSTYLVFFGVLAFLMSGIEFVFSIPPRWPFYIPFAAFLLQLLALTYVLPAWSRRYWSKAGRVFYTALVIGLFAFFWFLYYWNFIA